MSQTHSTQIKICGNTNLDDALMAVEEGADALGFIFFRRSPRYIEPIEAAAIIDKLPPYITIVGVFRNADLREIQTIAKRCRPDIIQLHGKESPELCAQLNRRVIKAFEVRNESDLSRLSDYRVSAYMLDTSIRDKLHPENLKVYFETGKSEVFDWNLAKKAKAYNRPVILAGGIGLDNVADAIEQVRPYGVDVVRGVEAAPGIKDPAKVHKFIQAVRSVEG